MEGGCRQIGSGEGTARIVEEGKSYSHVCGLAMLLVSEGVAEHDGSIGGDVCRCGWWVDLVSDGVGGYDRGIDGAVETRRRSRVKVEGFHREEGEKRNGKSKSKLLINW
ncbi:unnamed protein product [Linum trigynum]|uniref:Uncharacterized protein n=1 Tax=Linum trigynum TaxID=586398 RepID=A0AAV2F3Q2_9ROSI